MVMVIFVGGIFLGAILGCVIMGLLTAGGDRFPGEEAQIIGRGPSCAYPLACTFSPALVKRPQAFEAWLNPGVEREGRSA